MDNIAKITPRGTDLLLNGARPQPVKQQKAATKEVPVSIISPVANEDTPAPPNPTIEPKPPLKVAMIGTAPSSRDLAPFNDPSWQIWACSPGNAHGCLPRVDKWFEIHSNMLWPECQSYGGPYIEWLKQQKFPIYMQDQTFVPNAIPLPIQDLVSTFGKYFFTSSFAYMLAMAIKMGASEVAIFGVDVASKDEYIQQRAGVQYFMQEAAKRGIKVNVPYESDLAQPPGLYGYVDSTPMGRKIWVRTKELEARINQMRGERDKLNHSITYLEGALEDMSYWQSIWSGLQT